MTPLQLHPPRFIPQADSQDSQWILAWTGKKDRISQLRCVIWRNNPV